MHYWNYKCENCLWQVSPQYFYAFHFTYSLHEYHMLHNLSMMVVSVCWWLRSDFPHSQGKICWLLWPSFKTIELLSHKHLCDPKKFSVPPSVLLVKWESSITWVKSEMSYILINPGTYLTLLEAQYAVFSSWYGLHSLRLIQSAEQMWFVNCINTADH